MTAYEVRDVLRDAKRQARADSKTIRQLERELRKVRARYDQLTRLIDAASHPRPATVTDISKKREAKAP